MNRNKTIKWLKRKRMQFVFDNLHIISNRKSLHIYFKLD